MIKLEISGEKYCLYDVEAKSVKLYNLNHSIYKTIGVVPLTKYRSSNLDSSVSIAYISENLFNSDNLIEVLSFDGSWYANGVGYLDGSINIFNELGNVIFSGDSLMPTSKRGATYFGNEDGNFIFNTTAGAKMILYSYKNNTVTQNVYSLPGTLVAMKPIEINNQGRLSYPNPTNGNIAIPYSLRDKQAGVISISDLSGKIIGEYQIDNTFDTFIYDTSDLVAGKYFYVISSKTNNTEVKTGKFIVFK